MTEEPTNGLPVPEGELPESSESFGSVARAKSYLRGYLDNPEDQALADFSHNVCRIYMESPLSEGERAHAEELLRDLSHSVEVRVRETLSQQLKTSAILPHDVAVYLANDIESVALPMIEFSEVLTDSDLIDIINNKGTSHQTAVARRETVSERVSAAIVETGAAAPVETLLDNPGARIDEASYENVVVLFPNNDPIKEAMTKRPDLPVRVIGKLVDLVADHLQFELISRHSSSSKLIEKVIGQGNEGATIALLSHYDKIEEAEIMAAQLFRSLRLTPTILVRALYYGQLDFVEFALSRLSQVGVQEVRRQIAAPKGPAFRRLYRRCELPPQLFPVFCEALEHLRDEIRELNEEEEPDADARRRVSSLARHPDFDVPEFEATLLMTASA